MLGPVLLRLLCITVTTAAAPHAVTKLSAMTSTVPGSGMDSEGAFSFLGLDTGGSFAVEICQVTIVMMMMMMMVMMLTTMMMMMCQGARCCNTGSLNTEDDNWELGQVRITTRPVSTL